MDHCGCRVCYLFSIKIVDFSTKQEFVHQELFCNVEFTKNDCLDVGQNSYHCTVDKVTVLVVNHVIN